MTTWTDLLDAHAGPAMKAVLEARKRTTVYPELRDIYRAFDLTPFDRVRVVVLGQDCYLETAKCPICRDGWAGDLPCQRCGDTGRIPQATGLAFSVPHGVPIPPSLRNVFKELKRSAPPCEACQGNGNTIGWNVGDSPTVMCHDCDQTGNEWLWQTPQHGDLTAWPERGVLLLNSSLTGRAGEPGSHAKIWAPVITELLRALWATHPPKVWLVWGGHARKMMG